ncbi:DUF1743 domain-containing protein [Candidatus Thorarchaeota archaeon]|nr:MAG: DUF1743 domain-containing protein [Candidatus Thorarchaeota archaeon]
MAIEAHLGLDDIDSPRGGCTTHFASLLVERLSQDGVKWLDYPNLVRLNPNVPYRTRGNGAVALRFKADDQYAKDVLEIVREIFPSYVERGYRNTNPGVVLLLGKPDEEIREFGAKALWRVQPLGNVRTMLMEKDIPHIASGNGRGLIGAVSAIGNTLEGDCTYEFIAYRDPELKEEDRGVDPASVAEMNREMGDKTFANIDDATGQVLIQPNGPDPVLYGIRGNKAKDVKKASDMIDAKQAVERWMIFRTNQGTDAHLSNLLDINKLRPYLSARVRGQVSKNPRMIVGGHVIFEIEDESGTIECAAYEPTGEFRETVQKLIPGDSVELHAGVRPASRQHQFTLNIEGMKIVKLTDRIEESNPTCPECGKRMKSAGRKKGYKCTNCGFKAPDAKRVKTLIPREIKTGMYLPPARAQRHLTRPMGRQPRTDTGRPSKLIKKWHEP